MVALILVLIVVAVAAIAGILVWSERRSATAKAELSAAKTELAQARLAADQGVKNERELAALRESTLEEKLKSANTQLAELRPKSEELAAVRQQLASEQEKYAHMKADLDAAFKSAAADALRNNTESFLALAKQELGGQTQEAKQTLEAKEAAIKNMLDPLDKTLKSLDEQTRAMEKERTGAYSEIKTLVEGIGKDIPESLRTLRNETSQLVSALSAPKTRGDWGQEQLKRCVEYAGMVEYCSFSEQVSTRDEENQLLRPDMTIQLPNGRTIVVDAKTPSDLFSGTDEVSDPAAMKARLVAHASRVRKHLNDLSSKAYWRQFEHSPEFVVCFLPSEALFSAALEGDPELIRYGSNLNVVMATPTTFIALLKAVAYGWQQSQITERAKDIQETGRALYNKLVNAHEYFEKLGSALGNAIGNYNKMIGAVEGKQGAFYQARKLGNLANEQEELEVLEALVSEPRVLTAEDWPQDSQLAIAAEAESDGVL